jgi:hypothetical protein
MFTNYLEELMSIPFSTRFSIALLAAVFTASGWVGAQDPAAGNPEMQEMMKKWEEAGTPGAAHKVLNDFAGTWTVTTKWWVEGPDKPPLEYGGTSEVKWVLGGRFLEERYAGEMMGKSFEGAGHMGYDNFRGRYQFVWMDNSSTAIFMGSGTYDSAQKMLIFPVKMDDPGTGEKDKPGVFVFRIISPDKRVLEMYTGDVIAPGKKESEMVYVRK